MPDRPPLDRGVPRLYPPALAADMARLEVEDASLWCLSHRADPVAKRLADRHYSRQTPESPQFVPPGRCAVFVTPCARAYWVTSWPFAEYVKHRWGGAWVCSAFRSEGAGVASHLIRSAVAATRWVIGEPPELGLVTFIDRAKVRPIKRRGRDVWGHTWRLAGFEDDGETKGGLLALRLPPERMPSPELVRPQPAEWLPLFAAPEAEDAALREALRRCPPGYAWGPWGALPLEPTP